ncbi:MAG TPA: glycosyltransferase family 4 protein [Terriglobales bacterium]|nr:glycosyltransferase family 4 protein [Terriglobales bacterium]
MRILYFSDNVSDHNRRFLHELAASGHEVYFLNVTQQMLEEKWLPAGVQKLKVKRSIHRNADPSQFTELLYELQSLLKQLRPDVVHAGPVQTCGYVAALSGFHPLVVMSWGSDILVDAERDAEWRDATRVALSAADGFFCDCEAVRTAARRYASISSERIVQFPWGMKRGSFRPQGPAVARKKLGFGPETFVFISTRSWEPLYDTETLLRAFEHAYQQNRRLRLLLLGGGSMASSIRNFIAEHELDRVVIAPGMIGRKDMPRWFRAANAYLSCAKSDGTSVSLLEAMATGLPAVVTDIPSNREWIVEGENGWLARVGSSEEFSAKLLLAASVSQHDLAGISERNQDIVTQRADWDKNFPSLLRLYECLANSAMAMKA